MSFVFSTSTANIRIVEYNPQLNKMVPPTEKRSLIIKGGANLPAKTFVTPSGVVTEVSDDDTAWLMNQPAFQKGVKAGYFQIERHRHNMDTVVNDMKAKDGSAPKTPEDYAGEPSLKVTRAA